MFIGIINSPSLVTLLGLWFGVAAWISAINHHFAIAISCLMCAGLCDLFDGPVARLKSRSEPEKQFGQQIDSIADMANFCVVPGVLGYMMGLRDSWLGIFALVAYITSGAIRLAYFNVYGLKKVGSHKMFVGVPVTYTVLALPWIYLSTGLLSEENVQMLLIAYYIFMAIAFVIKVPVPKPGGEFLIIFPVYVLVTSLLMWWQ